MGPALGEPALFAQLGDASAKSISWASNARAHIVRTPRARTALAARLPPAVLLVSNLRIGTAQQQYQ